MNKGKERKVTQKKKSEEKRKYYKTKSIVNKGRERKERKVTQKQKSEEKKRRRTVKSKQQPMLVKRNRSLKGLFCVDCS